MSGDWIKMTVGLRSHPKVVRMASALKADRLRIVGGLHAVWSLFDQHSPDGVLEGYTFRTMDDEIGWRGFSAAMNAVEWLDEQEDGLSVPRFEEHNGASAKRRAMEAERKRLERERQEQERLERERLAKLSEDGGQQPNGTESGQTSASDADKLRTREEKEKKTPTPRANASRSLAFDQFWLAYPKKVGKGAAEKAWANARLTDPAPLLAALAWQTQSLQWTRDAGQYIPNPATYLNQRRWEDLQFAAVGNGKALPEGCENYL